jgi:integrase
LEEEMSKLKTKPNGIYFIDTEVDDGKGGLKRARISCDTRDQREAQAQLRDWKLGVHPKHPNQGTVVAAKGRSVQAVGSVKRMGTEGGMTVNRWLELCLGTIWSARQVKATATPRSNVKVITGILADDLLLADITATHVQQLVEELRRRDYAEGTVKRKLQQLSAALNEATRTADPATGKPYLSRRPDFPKIRLRNQQDRVVSADEEAAIFACIEARRVTEPNRQWWAFKYLVMVMIDTGFRLGEALHLGQRSVKRKRWLEPGSGKLMEATFLGLERYVTKNDKPRDIPATDRILRAIPTLNELARNGRWFPWDQGSGGPWYMWSNIRDDMAAKGFDVSDVKQHTFRHTCATRLAEGGMDLVSLRDWLGHSDIKITADRYIHLMSTHLYKGVAILNTGGTSGAPVPFDEEAGTPSVIRDIPVNGSNRAEPAHHVTLN